VLYDPPEYFGFVLGAADADKAKLVLTLMDKHLVFTDAILGSAVLTLKKIALSGAKAPMQEVVLALCDPETGDSTRAQVVLGVRLCGKSEGFGFGVERVLEYERWRPEQGAAPWGSSEKHLLPVDPGKWSATVVAASSSDHRQGQGTAATAYFWTLDEASLPLPPGWAADPWRASASFGDGGWQYSTAFRFTK
jgi:hypothetical protein